MVNGYMEEEDYKALEKTKNLEWLRETVDCNHGFNTYLKKPLLHLLYEYGKYLRRRTLEIKEREHTRCIPMGLGYTSVANVERMVERLRGAFGALGGSQQLNCICTPEFCEEVVTDADVVIETYLQDLATALGRTITIEPRGER